MSTPTQKQALEEAQTKITELEGKVSAAEGLQTKLDEATSKVSKVEGEREAEKLRADTAETNARTEKERADGLQTKLDEAGGKLTGAEQKIGATERERDDQKKRADDAEAKVANADQRHQEKSARNGIKPFAKDAKSASEKGDAKPTAAEIKEQYEAIEDKAERRAFLKEHESVLMS